MKKTISLLLIGILLISLFEIIFINPAIIEDKDKIITYERGSNGNPDLKVRIGAIGTMELKSHSNVNEIKQVLVGNQIVIWYEFNFNDNYINSLGTPEFKNIKNNRSINKNYSFYYLADIERDISIKDCSFLNSNGTQFCQNITVGKTLSHKEWKPYISSDIPKGNTTIGLMVNMEYEETLDIIWNVFNYKLDKHAIVTSGATTNIDGAYTIYTYLNNGTFNTTSSITNAQVLVIAGGGSGGSAWQNFGGGGGAGGLVYASALNITTGNYTLIVGVGGNRRASCSGNCEQQGQSGQNSSAFSLVAFSGGGGGGGSTVNRSGIGGGSGGGVGYNNTVFGFAQQINFSGATGFGRNGGSLSGGGGGGADNKGSDGTSGAGGNGRFNSINGTSVCYSGGGGGGGETANGGVGGCAVGPNDAGNGGQELAHGYDGLNGTGGGGGAGSYNGTTGFTAKGGMGGSGIIRIRVETVDEDIHINLINPSNNTVFTQNPIYLSAFLNKTTGVIIQNVSLLINGTINQTNTSSITGLYNFSISPADGIYYWNIEAYGNYSDYYSSINGTFAFNKTTPPVASPNQTLTIPNFTLGYSDSLTIAFTNYFSGLFANVSAYVNFSFIDYKDILLQSIIPTQMSFASNNTRYFLGQNFNLEAGNLTMTVNSYNKNRTIQVNATACNIGGCDTGNLFYINITEAEAPAGDNFIIKTSNWFSRILPNEDRLGFFQKLGLMFVVLLFVSILMFIGLNTANVEAPSNVYIIGIVDALLLFYFISIGYLSIWILLGLLAIIIGISFIGVKK